LGGEEATSEDLQDIFTLIDVNGDETIDKNEFVSLVDTLMKVLKE
jgi:Ca2+-binding EF-hand superfamily protein